MPALQARRAARRRPSAGRFSDVARGRGRRPARPPRSRRRRRPVDDRVERARRGSTRRAGGIRSPRRRSRRTRPARRWPRRARAPRGAGSGRACSLTVLKALGERVGQAGGADRGRARRRCRTRCAATAPVQALGVEQQPGGARVAVARLADAARVDEPLAVGEVEPPRRRGARSPVAGSPSRRTNDSATCEWPMSADALGRGVEAQLGEQRAEDVLPDRVARAGVVEADALARPRRGAATRSQSTVVGGEDLLRPARGERGAAGELVERRASPVTARSWLPARQTVGVLADERAAVVGVGAVADDVAQAPQRRARRCASTSASTASRAWRLPWMSETIATCMGLRGRAVGHGRATRTPARFPWPSLPRWSSRRPRPCSCGRATGSSRPRPWTQDRTSAPSPARPCARLPRAAARALRRRRSPIEAGVLVLARAPPAARLRGALPPAGARGGGRRRGAVGRARRRPAAAAAPSPTSARPTSGCRRRAGARGWATSARATAIGAVFAGVGAAAARRR